MMASLFNSRRNIGVVCLFVHVDSCCCVKLVRFKWSLSSPRRKVPTWRKLAISISRFQVKIEKMPRKGRSRAEGVILPISFYILIYYIYLNGEMTEDRRAIGSNKRESNRSARSAG